jgi:hypothetical protein
LCNLLLIFLAKLLVKPNLYLAIAPLYNYKYEFKDIEVSWLEKLQCTLFTNHPQLKYQQLVCEILSWLIYLHPDRELADFVLDAVATTLNFIPQEDLINNSKKTTKNTSRRYEGHQLNSRQALALLGKRGWVTCPEE